MIKILIFTTNSNVMSYPLHRVLFEDKSFGFQWIQFSDISHYKYQGLLSML